MIRAAELAAKLGPEPEPYYRRRLDELIASGRAVERPMQARKTKKSRLVERIRWRFTEALRSCGRIDAYWVRPTRHVAFRKVGAARPHTIPEGSVAVGRYAWPYSADDFLADLLTVARNLG